EFDCCILPLFSTPFIASRAQCLPHMRLDKNSSSKKLGYSGGCISSSCQRIITTGHVAYRCLPCHQVRKIFLIKCTWQVPFRKSGKEVKEGNEEWISENG
ncbi:hypothetical protein J4Q44_G00239050, partial [Coregonus suidteri]